MTDTLSEPATVVFVVERARAGRRTRAGCVRPRPANRRRARCVRWQRLPGRITRANAPAVLDTFELRGRSRGRALRPGRYRLVAGSLTDAAGNRGEGAAVGFGIRR